MPINRAPHAALVDDTGGGTDGTPVTKALIASVLLDPIDALVAPIFYIGDNANANMSFGVTINQGAADNECVALKSSDVTHGITSEAETDTFGVFKKANPGAGGLLIQGLSTGTAAFLFYGIATTEDSAKSTGASGNCAMYCATKSGTSPATPGGNANLFVVKAFATTRFILDADGDSHQDVGTSWTNFDAHDDVAVLQTLAAHVTRPDDPLRAGFGQWLDRAREPLERLGLVTFNADGHHFVNMSRLTMLLVGAARQMGQRVEHLTDRLNRMERRLGALEA